MAALLTSYGSLPLFGTTALAELVSTIDAGKFLRLEDLAPPPARARSCSVTLTCSVFAQTSSGGVPGAGVG